jgi:hypothetical protein
MLQRGDLAVAFVAVALSAGPVPGCSSPETRASSGISGAGGAGGSTSSGDAGPQITIDFDGSGEPPGCARLEGGAKSVPWAGTPAQAYCDGSAQNPPECPAAPPEAGSPCASNGLDCWYPSGAGWMVSMHCNKWGWSGVGHACADQCAPAAPEDAILGAPACGSLPDIPCDDRAMLTDQERLDWVLREVSHCCGYVNHTTLTIWIEDGCAVAARSDGPGMDQAFDKCIRDLLAGRRFSCGKALSCASVEWSTLHP